MKPDASNIGQERAIQDPADAVKREGGVYEDAAAKLPQAQTIDHMPKGTDPSPFANVRGPKSAGR
jgi:hypothetical protein